MGEIAKGYQLKINKDPSKLKRVSLKVGNLKQESEE
jgi:hypothetical protein